MQIQKENIVLILIVITGIFLIAALFMFFYITIFNERKKRHRDEKEKMKQVFDDELVRTGIEVQEQTRKNLAADLHDNIGQLLSLTSVILGSVNLSETEKAGQKIGDAHELVLRSIKDLRQLSWLIHGEQVLRQGLSEAIRQEISWLKRSGHFTIEYSGPGEEETEGVASHPEKDLFAYRLFQESLSNILKHAEADRITIGLQYSDQRMELTIRDNGIGFDLRAIDGKVQGLGLQGMQRRIALLNGHMDIRSEPGQGTNLHFIIPYT